MKNLAVVIVVTLALALGILTLLVFGTKSSTQSVSIVAATNDVLPSAPTQNPHFPLPEGEGRGVEKTSTTNQDIPTQLIRTNLNSLLPAPAEPLTDAPLPPLTIIDNARVVIHNYHDRFGENPVGENSEITAALMGKNPKQVSFITEESGLRTNDKGELLDGWGTPFFFHQVSSKEMEIRSAGEDRKLWTFDDQVTR